MRTHPTTRRAVFAATASIALVVGACGGSADSGTEFTIVGSETVDDPTNEVGFALADDDVTIEAPRLEVAVGEPVVVDFRNEHGRYSRTSGIHNFAVVPVLDDLPTLAATGALTDHVLWGSATPDLPSKERVEITFVPDARGTYYYVCTIPGHAKAGMMGELVVT